MKQATAVVTNWLVAIDEAWKPEGPARNIHEVATYIRKTYGEAWIRKQVANDWVAVVEVFAQQTAKKNRYDDQTRLINREDTLIQFESKEAASEAAERYFYRPACIDPRYERKPIEEWTPDDWDTHAAYKEGLSVTFKKAAKVARAIAKELRDNNAKTTGDHFTSSEKLIEFEKSIK